MANLETTVPALLIKTETSTDYFHVVLKLVPWDTAKGDFATWLSYDHPLRAADGKGMRVTCQGNNADRAKGLYAFDVEFEYGMRADDVVRLAKLATTLQRKLQAIEAKRGYVTDFGDYVARVCEALKIGLLVRKSQRFGDWKTFRVGDGVECIRNIVRDWQDDRDNQKESANG